MTNPVVHFEIHGKDGGKLQSFYREQFGWKVDADNPMNYGFVDTETGRGANGGILGGQDAAWVTFYIEVDDPQAYLDKIEKAGGRTITPVTEVPNVVTYAVFADPEGNRVGLVKS